MVIKKRKLVVIINGIGGVGKDTLINLLGNNVYSVYNVSSIDPIKQAASYIGYEGGKDLKDRKLLSDLKNIIIDYNDYPTKYLIKKYKEFLFNRHDIMFVHIREPEEIEKFKKFVPTICITLLVRGKGDAVVYNESADDNVNNYQYDYLFSYDKGNPNAGWEFINLVGSIFEGSHPIDPWEVIVPEYEEIMNNE